MNFKKLLLIKCQKQFYRNLQVGTAEDPGVLERDEDINEATLRVFDEQEIRHIAKIKIFGNIKLIGELFCLGQISDKIIQECIEYLRREITDQNIEIMC